MKIFATALLSITLGFAGQACYSQDPAAGYPSKPVRLFGQGTGSTADYLSRFLSQRLSERWGQPIVVDSRAGAGGTIPSDLVAKAAPDGYNMVMGHAGPFVSAVTLYGKDLPYDPLKDFEPVSMIATGVTVLVTNPAVPVSNAGELLAYAKQNGKLAFSSAGNGSISHLTGELLKDITGIPLQHIPYKSAGFALTAILTGEVQVSFLSPVTAYAQLKAGKVRALAVSSATRFPGAPDIPSAVEAGIPGMKAKLWFGLFTTGKTPRAVVQKINRDVGEILRNPENRQTILAQGIETAPSTPEELNDWVKSELAIWTPIIQRAGIKAD